MAQRRRPPPRGIPVRHGCNTPPDHYAMSDTALRHRATPDPLLDAAAAQRLDHPELLRDARHHAPPSGAALLGPPLAAAAVQRPDHLELTATRRPAPLLFQELSDPPRWLAGRLLQRPVPPNAHRAGGSPAPHTNLVQRSSALHTA